MTRKALSIAILSASVLAAGCAGIGPGRLKADQVDYARALGDAKKREILAAIVGLRFADAPSFLTVSSIIAAYTFDATGGAILNAGSGAQPNYAQATGSVSYSNHPTFTFTPTTGDAYASAYIRPLSPTLVMPLAESGIPIDLLLRITAQSIAGLQNGTALGGPNSSGSPQFFLLLQALRRLQLAGELNVESRNTDNGKDDKTAKGTSRINDADKSGVFITLGATRSGDSKQVTDDLALVRKLLHLSPKMKTYEIVYGQSADHDRIPMVTRSVLGILTDLGAQIAVPNEQVGNGATMPTIGLIGGETRPTIVVKTGEKPPKDAYVSVLYDESSYWIDRGDFDSKYAFTVVQNLMALAEVTDTSKSPVVTIPAN
ncbi:MULTISPECIES: hypothetical protein [unclassified Caballeronia]|uniref:hypothetical protein n=1 Tax=unclassified Caballeronia TaxID=2646786 RepID=UPI002860EE65|nr:MULTISPECIES: hypothetical protein [unclassified Caballeronia]MDR5813540.1 hypothetical protein [Caballeronia sp. LZ033]MDR5820297.1 hypothetical protein [Caballeronia sp. LZ043]MDR5878114.1 hypothetical protein [Caballeronia sp. LZ032]